MKKKLINQNLERNCEYNYPGCQKVTDLQYIKKLGTVTVYKAWICDNCLETLKKERNNQ